MEWKEHLGWLVPIIATVVLFPIFRYGEKLAERKRPVLVLSTVLLVVGLLLTFPPVFEMIAGG